MHPRRSRTAYDGGFGTAALWLPLPLLWPFVGSGGATAVPSVTTTSLQSGMGAAGDRPDTLAEANDWTACMSAAAATSWWRWEGVRTTPLKPEGYSCRQRVEEHVL